MIVSENLRIALLALRANKMRSVLTTLGIIIGVAAVIAVVSVVQGLQYMASGIFETVGATYVLVFPKREAVRNADKMAHQVKLTWEDGRALAAQIPNIRVITPLILGPAEVKYRDRRHKVGFVIGVNEQYQDVVNHTVDRGRFFSRLDLEDRRNVAVVGWKVVDKLALGAEPVGREIYIDSYPATIIGVMEKKGQALGQDLDDLVFVPFDSALRLFGRRAGDSVQLRLQARTTEAVDQVRDNIKGVLRRRHHLQKGQGDDFIVIVQDEILKQVTAFLSGVTAIIGGVVAISLVVGGIGIMNIMLVSVTERTREIGVRKAVGARRQDILVQFLIEAVTLSLAGGLIGMLLGYGIGAFLTAVLPVNLPPAHVPLWAMALAVGFSAAVGIFFGIYPAGKAAKLDPIEALRFE
jgi:putative ABC transport system permease protein